MIAPASVRSLPPPPLPFPLPLALLYARCSETSCPMMSRSNPPLSGQWRCFPMIERMGWGGWGRCRDILESYTCENWFSILRIFFGSSTHGRDAQRAQGCGHRRGRRRRAGRGRPRWQLPSRGFVRKAGARPRWQLRGAGESPQPSQSPSPGPNHPSRGERGPGRVGTAFTLPARLGKVLIPRSNSRGVRSEEGLRRGAGRAGSARSFPRRG